MKRALDISIIIPTRDRAESLRQTLLTIARVSTLRSHRCEVLVVDNSSTGSALSIVQEEGLRDLAVNLVREPKPGVACARNTGMNSAAGDILLFTDDDIHVTPSWIEDMISPIRSGAADAVAGGIRIAPHLDRPWMRDRHRAHLADTSRLAGLAEAEMVSANMAIARDVLQRVPAFDEELGAGTPYAGDETLFSWQLAEAGYRIVQCAGEPVEHHFDPSRLLRTSILSESARSARFLAYSTYHWRHQDVPALPIRLARSRLQLALWRALHPAERRREEGIEVREMEYAFAVSYFAELKRLIGTPRSYDRHGLVKRGGVSARPSSLSRAA